MITSFADKVRFEHTTLTEVRKKTPHRWGCFVLKGAIRL
jgi:hypothetical protein